MRRPVLNTLTALSLLLCLATSALWVRSYHVTESVGQADDAAGSTSVVSSRGQLEFIRYRVLPGHTADFTHARQSYFSERPAEDIGRRLELSLLSVTPPTLRLPGGFVYLNAPAMGTHNFVVLLPHWWVVALTAPLPVIRITRYFVGRRRMRSSAHPICPVCGYDLRATPDRCPECGTVP